VGKYSEDLDKMLKSFTNSVQRSEGIEAADRQEIVEVGDCCVRHSRDVVRDVSSLEAGWMR
jgi:hypothetical protein